MAVEAINPHLVLHNSLQGSRTVLLDYFNQPSPAVALQDALVLIGQLCHCQRLTALLPGNELPGLHAVQGADMSETKCRCEARLRTAKGGVLYYAHLQDGSFNLCANFCKTLLKVPYFVSR